MPESAVCFFCGKPLEGVIVAVYGHDGMRLQTHSDCAMELAVILSAKAVEPYLPVEVVDHD
jgi:hypothetical protein